MPGMEDDAAFRVWRKRRVPRHAASGAFIVVLVALVLSIIAIVVLVNQPWRHKAPARPHKAPTTSTTARKGLAPVAVVPQPRTTSPQQPAEPAVIIVPAPTQPTPPATTPPTHPPDTTVPSTAPSTSVPPTTPTTTSKPCLLGLVCLNL